MTEQKFLQEVQKVLDFLRSTGLKVHNPSGVRKEEKKSWGCRYERLICEVSTDHYFHYIKQSPILTFCVDEIEDSEQIYLEGIEGCANWSSSKEEYDWQMGNFSDEQWGDAEEQGDQLSQEIDKGLQELDILTEWDDDRATSLYEYSLDRKYQPYVLYL
jgi:hypothetical protein